MSPSFLSFFCFFLFFFLSFFHSFVYFSSSLPDLFLLLLFLAAFGKGFIFGSIAVGATLVVGATGAADTFSIISEACVVWAATIV